MYESVKFFYGILKTYLAFSHGLVNTSLKYISYRLDCVINVGILE